jgi:branched-subunit amino acid ABC-type transport system permease component
MNRLISNTICVIIAIAALPIAVLISRTHIGILIGLIIVACLLPMLLPSKAWLRDMCVTLIVAVSLQAFAMLFVGYRSVFNTEARQQNKKLSELDEDWRDGVHDMNAITQKYSGPLICAVFALGILAVLQPRHKKETNRESSPSEVEI